jgi:hypothetical protein
VKHATLEEALLLALFEPAELAALTPGEIELLVAAMQEQPRADISYAEAQAAKWRYGGQVLLALTRKQE